VNIEGFKFPPIHDPQWVTERSRELACHLGLSFQVWLRDKDLSFVVLSSKSSACPGQKKIYLSAGVHGDEPGSVLGLIRWLEQSAKWLKEFHVTILPCLNPWGLRQNIRVDQKNHDLNRSYSRNDIPSVKAHRQLLQQKGPFDLALLLHEDFDASGMYLYEVIDQHDLWGDSLLRAASKVVPIDSRPIIEKRAAKKGVIQRNLNSKTWQRWFKKWGLPEAVYIYRHHCHRVYTLETPSEFDLHKRARAHVLAVNEALRKLSHSP